MKQIVVFCGSGTGIDPVYQQEAGRLGMILAQRGISVVYGGARVGLMGAVADGALAHQGTVIGVIPGFLRTKEVAHEGLTELILVESMHERKTLMHELSDGVIALPGGFGTFEELFEMLTWAQLGLHRKPIGLLNTAGFYDDLVAMIQKMADKELLRPVYQKMLLVAPTIEELIIKMDEYIAPDVPKWIEEEEV